MGAKPLVARPKYEESNDGTLSAGAGSKRMRRRSKKRRRDESGMSTSEFESVGMSCGGGVGLNVFERSLI
jgi:hypothetical protein